MIKDEIAINGRVQMHEDTAPTPVHGEDPTAGARRGMPPMWRRLDASLVYDSRYASPAVGVRAARTGFPRLMSRAHGFEIDLQIRLSTKADRLRVLGQVVDDEFEPCSGWVVIESADGFVKTSLDDCGHFSIDGLVAGGHRFEVTLAHTVIEIPSVCL